MLTKEFFNKRNRAIALIFFASIIFLQNTAIARYSIPEENLVIAETGIYVPIKNILNSVPAPTHFTCFKMPKAQVNQYLTGKTGRGRMALRFTIKGMDNNHIGVKVYWVKKPRKNGGGTEAGQIPAYDLQPDNTHNGAPITVGENYILGNNYIRIKTIKAVIASIPAADQASFDHLRFKPVKITTGAYADQVIFLVFACDATGKVISKYKHPQKGVIALTEDGSAPTNPSPPATPGFD